MIKQALLVGVSTGPNALPGAAATVCEWHSFLSGRGFDVTSLVGAAASRQNILDEIDNRLVARAAVGAVLVLVVCAHGASLGGADYFMTGDDDGYGGKSISEWDTLPLWRRLRSTGVCLYYVNEACRDGQRMPESLQLKAWLERNAKALSPGFPEAVRPQFELGLESVLNPPLPVLVMKGCKAGKKSYYTTMPGNRGNFSMALMRAVDGIPGGSVGGIFEEATRSVASYGKGQEPELRDPGNLQARVIFT